MLREHGRYMGIDYGAKRIGLAVGDLRTRMAMPLTIVPGRGDLDADARAVLGKGNEFDVAAFVVGLPLNMDGSEGEQAGIARSFGARLAELSGTSVEFWDERLSTFAAEDLMRESDIASGKGHHRVDAVAAQLMLQGFLDADRHRPGHRPDEPTASDPLGPASGR